MTFDNGLNDKVGPLDVRFVNMPFAQISAPSIALTQLKARVAELLGDEATVKVCYANHDVAEAVGVATYEAIALGAGALNSGLGDWLYRSAAFPREKDNSTEYLRRYSRMLPRDLIEKVKVGGPCSPAKLSRLLDQTIDKHDLAKADVVGFTTMFAQTVPSLAMAKRLRERNPTQILVLGGANCEGSMGATLAEVVEDFDFIFSGPALISFPEFLGHIRRGDLDKAASVKGVLPCRRRREPGKETGQSASIREQIGADLDINVPVFLDYGDFLDSLDGVPGPRNQANIQFETSRGCWWGERAHCTFCGLNGGSMAYRAMAPEAAVALLSDLIDRYQDRTKKFSSVDNIMPKEFVSGVFEHLCPSGEISIFYETKADLSDEDVRIISRGGVRAIQPGIESLLTSTLKLMRKGTTAFQNIRLLKSCLKYDVNPAWNLLVGFPGEDADGFSSYLEILPKLHHLYPPTGVYPVRFDRYSPYHTSPESFGIDLIPADFYSYCYPYTEEQLVKLAYYFENISASSSYMDPLIEGIGGVAAAVMAWQSRAAHRAAFGPPRLDIKARDGNLVIEDSRAGAMTQHPLTAEEILLLAALRAPREISWGREKHPAAFDRLQARNLLFEERGRAMSVVMDPDDLLPKEEVKPAVDRVSAVRHQTQGALGDGLATA
jgi:ribosomal peptide maturation radical SAM protein 1